MRVLRIGEVPAAEVWVRGDEHVAGQGAHDVERPGEVLGQTRVARVVVQLVAGGGQAVHVGDAHGLAVAGVGPGPGGAARGVAGYGVGSDLNAAEFDDLAI